MQTLREDWSGSFNSSRYISVNEQEYESIKEYAWMRDESFKLGAEYHNYDGFVEKSKSGIEGDKFKAVQPYPETTIYYILNGRYV